MSIVTTIETNGLCDWKIVFHQFDCVIYEEVTKKVVEGYVVDVG